jgi:hypothetical protein
MRRRDVQTAPQSRWFLALASSEFSFLANLRTLTAGQDPTVVTGSFKTVEAPSDGRNA